ncbi:MAG: PBECR2 nuclease fold domain-containing protein [Clostridium sp.]
MEKKYNAYKKIGKIDKKLLKDLGISFNNEVYIDKSVLKHIRKRHKKQLTKNIKNNINTVIEKIIKNPDYVGINKNKDNISLKFIKKIEVQMVVVLNFDYEEEYIYIATMYPLIKKRFNSKIENGDILKISG